MYRVTTTSGSVYHIDLDKMTWERVEATERSGNIRTNGGTLYGVRDMEIGKRMHIDAPGLYMGNRWIHTMPVVKIEEL